MRALALLFCAALLGMAGPAGAAAQPPEPPPLTAAGAVLWDPADDRVLYGREADVPRPMASATKLMTVLLAAEAGALDDIVTVSPGAAALGGATLHLRAGQRVPMNSLVAGLLLQSGNDAAVAVSEHVAGSVDAYVAAMNERAAALGLDQTRFVDPHGLNTDPEHRSSPLDLARLAHEAMAHPVIADYARMPSATVPGLPPLDNRNELIGSYAWATGVKTGYTALAGLCLVAGAERDGRTLYAVVLDSANRFGEAAALLDYGFEAFRRAEPLADGAVATRYRWADAEVAAVAAGGLTATVPAAEAVAWRTRLAPAARRPLRAGDDLGRAELLVGGTVVGEVPLVAAADVAATDVPEPAAAVGGGLQEALRAFARLAEVDRAA